MLWNPTSYLQSCIQIEAELALSLFQLQICIFKVLSTSTWSATAVQIFYFDVCWHAIKQIIWILACFGVIQHSFLEVGEQGMQGRKGGGAICNLSAGPVMYSCGLDGHSQRCVLLLSVPWHSGHFNPQFLLTGTPQPATMCYSFTATLVFIISTARPH